MYEQDKLHEECGVFGIFRKSGESVVGEIYHALYALQHRGQESCGMAINKEGVMHCQKDVGLLTDVFTRDVLDKAPDGHIGVGHCLYGTTATKNHENAQPLVVNYLKGSMAVCHNGALTNYLQLREELAKDGAIFHTSSNAEVIAYTITRQRINTHSVEDAVFNAMSLLKGAFSLVIMSPKKLIAARDPHGYRPLCMGHLGEDIVFASESCAFDAIGATFDRDIEAGEMVVVSDKGIESRKLPNACHDGMCIFEYIYFARPDSVVDGASVHEARLRAGAFLALEHPVQADVVIGAPDSGIDAAIGYARQSGIPYGMGFIKNRYIGRTFIQPTQKQRTNSVRIKLNAITSTIKDKRVVLVDDSIVRGTTSKHTVQLLRDAGAKEVHYRLSSPPFVRPCYFGTDIDSTENLIAANHTIEEIREIIGVDSIGFLSVEACDKIAVGTKCGFCKGCFTGKYPEETPEDWKYTMKFETPIAKKED